MDYKSRSTAATDFLDDCATVVTLLDDDSAATTNVHTHAMMPMAMAVAVAITTDTDVNARAVATPPNPRAFTLPAAHGNAATPAFPAPFAPITIAALTALGTGPFARLPGLRGLTRRRTALSPGRGGASRRLSFCFGVLGEGSACAEQQAYSSKTEYGLFHSEFPRLEPK
jgi:hypothetical protein